MSFKAFMRRKTQLTFSINIPPAFMFIIRSGTRCLLYLSCLQYTLGVNFLSPFISLHNPRIIKSLAECRFCFSFPKFPSVISLSSCINKPHLLIQVFLSMGKLSSIHFNMSELLLHRISASLSLFYFCFPWLLKLSWLKTRFVLIVFLFGK